MTKNMRKILAGMLLMTLFCPCIVNAAEEAPEETVEAAAEMPEIGIAAPHAILMEASTGTVLYEKDAHTAVPPASVTKIMTMLLIFEAIEDGKIGLDDTVVVSERAASMGGSQVYLEPNEKQTVETMLKCIAVASANDACASFIDSRHKRISV